MRIDDVAGGSTRVVAQLPMEGSSRNLNTKVSSPKTRVAESRGTRATWDLARDKEEPGSHVDLQGIVCASVTLSIKIYNILPGTDVVAM